MPLHEALPRLLDRGLVELAKTPAERHQILIAERLVAKQEDLMFEPRPMDRGKQLVVERSQIDALHFGAERRARRSNAQTIRAAGCDTGRLGSLGHRGSLESIG